MAIPLNQPLDDTNVTPDLTNFLANLQANILTGHGREHIAIFFAAVKEVEIAKAFLHDFPVTTALEQLIDRNNFKENGEPGGVIRLVFLTQLGLSRFGKNDVFPAGDAFAQGMKNRPEVLDNNSTNYWQNELKKDIHVAFLIAYHDLSELEHIAALFETKLEANGFDIVFIQAGNAFKNGAKEGIEHFGYVDGRSQPLMLASAIEDEKTKKGGGIANFDPTANLDQFIFADPLLPAAEIPDGFGSFFVFRKLEQNVAGFKRREEELADALGLVGEKERERAGAMVVGRFEDGTPLVLSDEELSSKELVVPVVNDFNYSQDTEGGKCPFQGHIRKSNPRSSHFDLTKQMARRGITYGSRIQDPATGEFVDKPNDGVGLLFMSYQHSIESQFEFIQTAWVNSETFPGQPVPGFNPGTDPVIGQNNTNDQTWFPNYGSTANPTAFSFHDFVTLKGGDYFYTPSPKGLKAL